MTRRRWGWFLAALAASSATAAVGPTPTRERLEGELRLRVAVEAGDAAALEALHGSRTESGEVRGAALWLRHRGDPAPVSPAGRARLLAALSDPAAPVRQAALRLVGVLGERTLERDALKRVAEDSDPEVRIEGLRAVRRWGRQSHLYFLEPVLESPWNRVRAEAVANLGGIALRELPPEVIGRVRTLAAPGTAAVVREQAFLALQSWGRLEWEAVAGALGDRTATETLRLRALEISDAMALTEGRDDLLVEILDAAPSLRLAWEAYRRLVAESAGLPELAPAVARFLAGSDRRNSATDEMAGFLRTRGYRAEFRAGTWHVAGR